MSKHTPGPWVANLTSVEPKDEHEWVNDGWIIANCQGSDALANAHLIAAAPDLYEALVDIHKTQLNNNIHDPDDYENTEQCRRIKAAIAKAKGEI